jgi:septal ring factor EnvC (AmiA/AmiB activator)
MRTRPFLPCGLAASALLLVACAGMPPPTDQMAVSAAAVMHAAAAGATELAPLELSQARDKMTRAQAAIVAKEYPTALALAQQAQLDAQLAEAKAESAKAAKAAQALQDAGTALRDEMARKAP